MTDLIRKQDAINEIKNVFDDVLCCNVSVRKGLPEAVRRIEMMPPAEQKQGKWKIYGKDDHRGRRTGERITICDQCGKQYTIGFGENLFNYCPNCGAHMEQS